MLGGPILNFAINFFKLDLDARPWDFQMEECKLRTCVDRFNTRRYLSGQLNVLHRNNVPTSASMGTANLSNQMSFTAGNISGGIGNNGNNTLNTTANGIGVCISSQPNGNCQHAPIVVNDLNEPCDNNGMGDVAVNSMHTNSGQDKCIYTPGYGGWDFENVVLSDEFKQHYELWLQKEVYDIKIDWDSLQTVYDIEMDAINKRISSNHTDKAADPINITPCEITTK